ncbi:mCG62065, partial [Mus musculus]
MKCETPVLCEGYSSSYSPYCSSGPRKYHFQFLFSILKEELQRTSELPRD